MVIVHKKRDEYDNLILFSTALTFQGTLVLPVNLFSIIRIFLFSVILAVILSSCSSNTSKTQSASNKQQNAIPLSNTLPEQKTSSVELLQQLKQQPQVSEQTSKRTRIQAAYIAIYEQQPQDFITKIVSRINPNIITTIEDDIQLANLYIITNQVENAEKVLERLKLGALPNEHLISMRILTAQIEHLNENHLSSLRILFRLNQLYQSQYNSDQATLSNDLIWQNILKVPVGTLRAFKNEFGSEADSWLSLATLLNDFMAQPLRFNTALNNWYNKHQAFDSFQYLPESIQQLTQVQAYQPLNIVLMLPLTAKGNLSEQAQAIRNGFLAADNFNSDINITLVDTTEFSITKIEQLVQSQQVDFIVGPLLKENITSLQSSEVLNQIPRLNLNTISNTEINTLAEQFFFALAPEDEIEQAVEHFQQQNIKHPALIYADNSHGRRLASRFTYLWQQSTQKQLETIAFKSRSKLGVAVKELLDVGVSEARIDEIKKLFGSQVEAEQRSRKDIDAIYIIANSEQTRLIKPFFDVNVSTFGERLPIYASSRSFVVGETINQKKDLNDLIFTEMRWMVENNNDNATQIYQQIGDNITLHKKLFAFGYDARKLIPLLKPMAILPELTIEALTGELSITEQQRIKRNLHWSQYRQGRVVVLQKQK